MTNNQLFLLLPLGFLIVGIIIFSRINLSLIPGKIFGNNDIKVLTVIFLFYTSILICLKFSKLYHFNYVLFDSGLYVNKLYKIAQDSSMQNKIYLALISGHFQPVLLLYSAIFEYLPYPQYILYALQSIFIASGIFPLFYLGMYKTGDFRISILISIIYLVYPLTSFNDILGFNPDHLVLPSLLFAFYFAETKKYTYLCVSLIIISLTSEPWVPLICFFGVYLVLGFKKNLIGIFISIIALIYFLVIYYYVLRLAGSGDSGYILSELNSPYANLIKFDLSAIISDLNIRKLFYLYFIFVPLLFIPILRPLYLIVAIPEIAKSLLSSEPLHYAVEGHYTLGLIGCLFAAFVSGIQLIRVRYGYNVALKLTILSLCVTFLFSILHSCFPWSKDFWSSSSNGDFNIQNYLGSERSDSLAKIDNYFLNVPNEAKVQISNSAYFSSIAKKNLLIFPGKDWKNSDYLILSNTGRDITGAIASQSKYILDLNNSKKELSGYFKLIYSDKYFDVWSNKSINKSILN